MKLLYELPGRGTTVFILWMVPICAPFSFSSVSRAENIEDMRAILVLFRTIHRIAPECENCSALQTILEARGHLKPSNIVRVLDEMCL